MAGYLSIYREYLTPVSVDKFAICLPNLLPKCVLFPCFREKELGAEPESPLILAYAQDLPD
jgi:hypothetical protein